MALAGEHALAILERIGNANAKGEFYLTDAVAIARDMGLKAVAIETGRTKCAASTPRRSSPKPKPCCSTGCARRRWKPASP